MIIELQLTSSIVFISAFSLLTLMFDVIFKKNKKLVFITAIAGLILTILGAAHSYYYASDLIQYFDKTNSFTRDAISFDGYTSFFDILFSIAGILTLLSAKPYLKREDYEHNEFYSLLLFSIFGMMLIGHAKNLLIMFLGIEIMSLSFYVLTGFFRNDVKSVEASLKYFLLGSFSTGFLLYGMALIYGATGTINLAEIHEKALNMQITQNYMLIGIGLIMVGLCFKVAIFPFHQWAPDVYQGSPTVISAFMSTAGKSAAIVAFMTIARFVMGPVSFTISGANHQATAQIIIAILSALTMLLGNITALVQKNIKRMLAYSSVAHAGYLLMGIVANNTRGWSAILYYLTAYMFMQIGAFVVVSIIERNNDEIQEFNDYIGLSKKQPLIAAMMAIFMFSLAGLPPFAGFFGKYYLFAAAVEAGYTWLTIIAVISTIISMYFYISLVLNMYFKDREEAELNINKSLADVTLIISTIFIIILGIFPSFIISLAQSLF